MEHGILASLNSQTKPDEWWWWGTWKFSNQLSYSQVSTHSSKKAHNVMMMNQMNDFNSNLAPLWRLGQPASMRALWTACCSLVSSSPALLPWTLCKHFWWVSPTIMTDRLTSQARVSSPLRPSVWTRTPSWNFRCLAVRFEQIKCLNIKKLH